MDALPDPIPSGRGSPGLRVALVHDQLYTFGGAERVLAELLRMFPEATVFALFDVLPAEQRGFLGGRPVVTTWLQRLPGLRRLHRSYFMLMPIAIEQLDLQEFDVIVSSSYLVAKGVIVGPDQLHVCYLHSPMRYAWDQQHQYLNELRLTRGLRSAFARIALHYLRQWDARSSAGVDVFLANSHFVARRARHAYRRTCHVLPPPVEVDRFRPGPPLATRPPVYVTLGRLVPAKGVDRLIEAFTGFGDRRLVIVGDGPDLGRLQGMAGPGIELRGRVGDDEAQAILRGARAFVFAAEEDFGIAPIEALAAGTPVVGLRRGGLRETVKGLGEWERPTGVFFGTTTPQAIRGAILELEVNLHLFSPQRCHAEARRYAPERFRRELGQIVSDGWSGLQEEMMQHNGEQPYERERESA